MSLDALLESFATHRRPRVSVGADRSTTYDYDTDPLQVVTDIPCSVQPASADVQAFYAQDNIQVNTTVYFAENIRARVHDRVDVVDEEGVTHKFVVRGFRRGLLDRAQSPYHLDCWEVPAR